MQNGFHFLLTYFSIGSLIASVMLFFGALLLLSLSNKSSATLHLGLMLLLLAIFSSGYIFASSFFDDRAAFHRWITVCFVLPGTVQMTQFFFHYPSLTKPKLARAFLIVGHFIAIGLAIYFLAATLDAPRIYRFDGHYWDFNADQISAQVARVIQMGIVSFVLVGSWRTVVTPGRERWVVMGMLLGLMIVTVVPSALNTRSREGGMDRGTFVLLWDLLSVPGVFCMIVLYINNTRDQTSFMAKIIGISLVVALLILQALSFFLMREREDVYDAVHVENSRRILLDHSRPEDLQYITELTRNGEVVTLFSDAKAAPIQDSYRVQILNTAWRNRIENLPDDGFQVQLNLLLKKAHPAFGGYGALIKNLEQETKEVHLQGRAIFEKVDAAFFTILSRYNKIQALPEKDFRAELTQILRKDADPTFHYFKEAIEIHLTTSVSENAELKNEVLAYLSLIKPTGFRLYREQKTDPSVAFVVVDASGSVFELGYSYLGYRQFVHSAGLTLSCLLGGVLLVILGGFRIFFLGALINPLNALQRGMRNVNGGNLDIALPIQVEDEIGFMTRSFNGMVRSIRSARNKMADYAGDLESKVSERTQQLQVSLDEVRALKQQQDGDYFLTSLLIKPLATNQATKGNVAVQFLVRQKKRFDFKKWKDEEIGGDICMADTIRLNEKDHTVFLNGDAMGKSIQGAGGALVLGSVFEAIVERTKLTQTMQNQYPERWLKNTFVELQKVFESFDGYMLVSMVIGLVDNTSGLVYYMNAEHPWTVLYRSGAAKFIDNEMRFRKLGMTGMENRISIETFQMQPGDVLIAGSDGRDDLVVGIDQEGKRIINEDETRFLESVESGDGQLQEIYQKLMKIGEIMDDLSLLRISFLESNSIPIQQPVGSAAVHMSRAQSAIRQKEWSTAVAELEQAHDCDSVHPRIMRALSMSYYKAGQFAKAATMAESYIFLRPDQTEFVYLASYCFKLSGQLRRAIDLGERVRLRSPNLVKNLVNLADLYLKIGNQKQAKTLLRDALDYNPEHPAGNKLSRLLLK